MIKVVTLRMEGNLKEAGFQVDVDVGREGYPPDTSFSGTLLPMPELAEAIAQWQRDYQDWGIPTRIRPKEVVFTGLSQRTETCRASAQKLSDCFLQWLESAEFLKLDTRLREVLQRDDTIRIMLRTQSTLMRKLPWHLWELVDRYSHAEVVLSATTYETIKPYKKADVLSNRTVKILAILGNATGINTTTDQQLLSDLPNAELTFLVEPSRSDMNNQLWDQSWDILFFAGHSQTEEGHGRIYLNQSDSLTLDQLKYGLRKAIKKGLTLAIFNSCDGLGLAYELEQLSLPHLIVMREPVPDKVAHTFLTHFLPCFAQGHSLYEAVREARERLQGMEYDFPCASWLPVVYQQPLRIGPTWQGFTASMAQPLTEPSPVTSPLDTALDSLAPPTKAPLKKAPLKKAPLTEIFSETLADVSFKQSLPSSLLLIKRVVIVAIATIIVTSLVVGVRSLGLLQTSELRAYDHFMQLRSKPVPDERLLVITVDKADIDYQDAHHYQRREGWSLSDKALAEVLKTLGQHQPRAVGLDIAHPYPFDPSVTSALAQYNLNVVGACVVGTGETLTDDATPPPGFTFENGNLGFADIAIDPDGVVRRQLPLMAAGEPCRTSQALSLQLVHQYLAQEGLNPIQKLPNGDRVIGGYQSGHDQLNSRHLNSRLLKRLPYNAGGYQLPTHEAYGYQMLLNYRYSNPITIPLQQILSAQELSNFSSLVKDRIILIGVNQPQQDRHHTSLHKNTSIHQNIPGVMIHAHMVSHLLDIALENKSQLWWWPQWAESLWIAVWTTIGSSLIFFIRSYWKLGLSIFITVMILYSLGWIVFTQDGWIPLVPAAAGILLAASTVAIIIKRKIFRLIF